MTPETTDLVAALTILKRQIPGVCLAMTQGELSPDKQAEFGDLLIQLGQHLQQHATPQIIDGETEPASDSLREPARHRESPRLLAPATDRQDRLSA